MRNLFSVKTMSSLSKYLLLLEEERLTAYTGFAVKPSLFQGQELVCYLVAVAVHGERKHRDLHAALAST